MHFVGKFKKKLRLYEHRSEEAKRKEALPPLAKNQQEVAQFY